MARTLNGTMPDWPWREDVGFMQQDIYIYIFIKNNTQTSWIVGYRNYGSHRTTEIKGNSLQNTETTWVII